jgi:hypothetical protein
MTQKLAEPYQRATAKTIYNSLLNVGGLVEIEKRRSQSLWTSVTAIPSWSILDSRTCGSRSHGLGVEPSRSDSPEGTLTDSFHVLC